MTTNVLTVFPSDPERGGKGVKGGDLGVTNSEFIAAVFKNLPPAAFAAVCSKPGDPTTGGWGASRAGQTSENLPHGNNNYVCCSSFYFGDDGSFKARKDRFAACHFLMLDDLGTKIPFERLAGFELSWLLETSPGNHQGGIILANPITNSIEAVRLLNALINAGLCDPGATGPLSRWARLPVAINGKPKHADAGGNPFHCRLVKWQPEKCYTPEEVVDNLQLDLAPSGRPRKETKRSSANAPSINDEGDDVLTPKNDQNPVVSKLKEKGLYKTPLGSGRHDITCPWAQSIQTDWTPVLPILNLMSNTPWADFVVNTHMGINSTLGSCSNSLGSAQLRHGINPLFASLQGPCTGLWMRRKKS